MIRFSKDSFITIGIVLFHTMLFANKKDSLKIIKPAKHYFKTTIYTDYYTTSQRDLAVNNFVSKRLNNYKLNQFVLGFNTPLFTSDYYNHDSTTISNLHLLLTGNYSLVQPIFSGIKNHSLIKTSLGTRIIYNTGKKSLFFSDFSLVQTKDRGYNNTKRIRTAFSFIYNYTVNKSMGLRLGFTRTFLFGNRFFLPYIGLRFGKIDAVNFSIQFPRIVSLNIPIGRYIKTSIYTKPQGGLFSMANTDSLYYVNNDKNINFGRYEFLLGTRIDINPSKLFGVYVGAGISTQNRLNMYSETYNRNNRQRLSHFYSEKISGALFINFGATIKFGKTKSIYNNYNLYDAIDLNNSFDSGDNNINSGNSEIPKSSKKIKNIKLADIEDLIETQDLY